MEVVNNEDAVKFLSGDNSLLDSKLISLHVYDNDHDLQLELTFSGRHSATYASVKLLFCQVSTFDFSHSKDFVFGNVERVKFLTTKDGAYYLSLDPDDNSSLLSSSDRDFVMARSVAASIIDKRQIKDP